MITNKKERFFREFFRYWSGKFNLKETIKIRITKENLIAAADDKSEYLYYNQKEINKLSYALLVDMIFHEIGHLVNNLSYDTRGEKISAEYAAENFAISNIEEHYPKYLEKVLESLYNEIKDTSENDIYREAYMKIPIVNKYFKTKGIN